MIITRSPLRISLGGGGTDLPSYYREHAGFVISAAIDKYVYITLHETFAQEVIVKYSKMEVVQSADDIKHPIVREALKLVQVGNAAPGDHQHGRHPGRHRPRIVGQFYHGACCARCIRMKKNYISRQELAEQACHIEIDLLGEPIGKQDQYIASFGGITVFRFQPDDSVEVAPLQLAAETLHNLEDNLALFFTGFTRSASQILQDQDTRSRQGEAEMLDNLHFIKQIGCETQSALERGDLRRFAELMHDALGAQEKAVGRP